MVMDLGKWGKKKKEWKESDVYLKSWKAANIISGERYNGSTGV